MGRTQLGTKLSHLSSHCFYLTFLLHSKFSLGLGKGRSKTWFQCVCLCVCLSPLILALQGPSQLISDTNSSNSLIFPSLNLTMYCFKLYFLLFLPLPLPSPSCILEFWGLSIVCTCVYFTQNEVGFLP